MARGGGEGGERLTGVVRARRERRPLLLLLSIGVLLGGAAMFLAGSRGETVRAADTSDLEGTAWVMKGIAYNTQQPIVHHILLPPGGTNDSPLEYAFPTTSQLLLSAESSRVSCNSSGNTPGASSGHAFCEVILEGFELWVGPYQIIESSRIAVRSSSSWSNGKSQTFPSVSVSPDTCVYIERDFAGGCVHPQPGVPVQINRPPISGTVTLGGVDTTVSNGNQLGAGSWGTAFHVNLLNDNYDTSTGIRSVTIDIAYAESFAGQPDWTPTPTPTNTPTPTPSPTPGYKALLPVVSRDQ